MEELRIILRSLIMSSPHAITIGELERDFVETECREVPYRKMGFKNFHDLLKNFNDIFIYGHGHHATVSCVASKESQHVQKLVAEQKKPKNKPGRQRFKIAARFSDNRHNATTKPRYLQTENNANFNSKYRRTEINSRSCPPQKSWQPEKLWQQQQRSAVAVGLTPNFSNLSLYYKQMPNVKSQSLREWQGQQQKHQTFPSGNCGDPLGNSYFRSRTNQHIKRPELRRSPPRQPAMSATAAVSTQSTYTVFRQPKNITVEGYRKQTTAGLENVKKREGDETTILNKVKNVKESEVSSKSEILPERKKVDETDVENYLSIQNPAINHSWSNSQPANGKQKVLNKKIDCENYIKNSGLIEQNEKRSPSLLPNNSVKEIETNRSDFYLQSVEDLKNAKESNDNAKETSKEDEPLLNNFESYAKRIQNYIANIPTNLQGLPTSKYPFFADSESEEAEESVCSDEALPVTRIYDIIYSFNIAEDIANSNDDFMQSDFPADFKVGSITKIYISEVYSPYQFWFQISEGAYILDEWMEKLNIFYNEAKNRSCYNMTASFVSPGRICIAPYIGYWHRAKILTNLIDGKVKVYFVDYGTVGFVLMTELRHAAVRFLTLPTQALRGCLAHVKPIGRHWSYDASFAFSTLVSDKALYARFCEIDEKRHVFYMKLCDTHESETVRIHDELIAKGYAELYYEWVKKRAKRWRHKREEYPTFELLESGEYPNLGEISDLLNKGIDYEEIIDKRLYSNLSSDGIRKYNEMVKPLDFPLFTTNPFLLDILSFLEKEYENTANDDIN